MSKSDLSWNAAKAVFPIINGANSVLLAEGYERTSASENTYNYRKHYVCIGFDFDDNGVLVGLGISVEDLAYRDIEY